MTRFAIWLWITIISAVVVVLCRIYLWSLWLQLAFSALLVFGIFRAAKNRKKEERPSKGVGWFDSD